MAERVISEWYCRIFPAAGRSSCELEAPVLARFGGLLLLRLGAFMEVGLALQVLVLRSPLLNIHCDKTASVLTGAALHINIFASDVGGGFPSPLPPFNWVLEALTVEKLEMEPSVTEASVQSASGNSRSPGSTTIELVSLSVRITWSASRLPTQKPVAIIRLSSPLITGLPFEAGDLGGRLLGEAGGDCSSNLSGRRGREWDDPVASGPSFSIRR